MHSRAHQHMSAQTTPDEKTQQRRPAISRNRINIWIQREKKNGKEMKSADLKESEGIYIP